MQSFQAFKNVSKLFAELAGDIKKGFKCFMTERFRVWVPREI